MIKFAVLCGAFLLAGGAAYPQHSWEYFYERGSIEYRAGMHDYAVFSLEKCLEANPRSFEAANMLAEIHAMKNKTFKAIEYYELSLLINDNQSGIHSDIALLYEFTGEKEKAFKHFLRAAELDPAHVRARCSLVRFFYEKNDRKSAESNFQISFTIAAKKLGNTLAEASNAQTEGKLNRAAALYKKAADEGPCLIEAYIGLYETYRRMNNYMAAAEIIEKLKLVKPDYEKAYVILGGLYFTQRLPGKRKLYIDKAIANLKKAIELNPDNSESYYTLSDVYRYVRKYDDARIYEEKAREIDERAGGRK